MKKIAIAAAALLALAPSAARAANVYIPIVCQPQGTSGLECEPNDPGVIEVSAGSWIIEIDENDTLYLQVSDFTVPGSGTYVVSAESSYTSGSVNWTKSGSTATSPGDTPEVEFDFVITADNGSVRRGGGHIHVRTSGG